jgi:hypothetical protein
VWLVPLYATLGWLAVWSPWRIAVARGTASNASNPIDGMSWVSLPLLGVVGAIGGLASARSSAWWATTSMVAFPLLAFVDIGRDPTSHNLWPLEFLTYAAESLLAVAGAALARRLARRDGAPTP